MRSVVALAVIAGALGAAAHGATPGRAPRLARARPARGPDARSALGPIAASAAQPSTQAAEVLAPLGGAACVAGTERLQSALGAAGGRVDASAAAGSPIFMCADSSAALAEMLRELPASRRADAVVVGECPGLLLTRLEDVLTPTQQGELTIVTLWPGHLSARADALQPCLVRGKHAERACELMRQIGVPCEIATAQDVEARLIDTLLALSAVWLLLAASGLADPDSLWSDARWLRQLEAVLELELLPAARRLALGKDVRARLSEPGAVLARLRDALRGREHASCVPHARRAWAERNGLLLSTEPDRVSQPIHRWLIALAGQHDMLGASDGDGGCEEAGPLPIPVGAVYAALPGLAERAPQCAWLERAVLITFEATEESGVGALVLNQPMPLTVGELSGSVQRFAPFENNVLHAGGELGTADTTPADMMPWYWLHTCDFLVDSRELSPHARMGGDTEMAGAAVAGGSLDPSAIRFFWRHLAFGPGEFEAQVEQGLWRRLPPSAWQAVC